MTHSEDTSWDICAHDGCIGVRLPTSDRCWTHADEPDLEVALEQVHENGEIDARGVSVTAELLDRLLDAAFRGDRVRSVLGADFSYATFEDAAIFEWVTFTYLARFYKARFKQEATFLRAAFDGLADFTEAIFERNVQFQQATFSVLPLFLETEFNGDVAFSHAKFKYGVMFSQANFSGSADFSAVTFSPPYSFYKATFSGWADFLGAGFYGWAMFHDTLFKNAARFSKCTFFDDALFQAAKFEDIARFDGVIFSGSVDFSRAFFESASEFGPVLVRKQLDFRSTTFNRQIKIRAAAGTVDARAARFLAGVHLQLRWAQVILDDADLTAPSLLATTSAFPNLDETTFVEVWKQRSPPSSSNSAQARLSSVRGADVSGLTLTNVDLRACRFVGAHNLDQLKLEASTAFATTPGAKVVETGWAWPPAWWWTRRQTLAEEHIWRATYEHGVRQAGWHADVTSQATTSPWVPNPRRPTRAFSRLERHLARTVRDARQPQRLRRRLARARRIGRVRARREREQHRQAARTRRQQAREVASVYRALRKAREDSKDEPGAADFYYGEMEMRRHASPRLSAERAVLTLYWLAAGYALRAWRALTVLALVLVLAAWLLVDGHGFFDSGVMTFWGALRYSARIAIGLAGDSQPRLTPWGEVLQIAVRVLVPALLGLAVLSIRGRVKR